MKNISRILFLRYENEHSFAQWHDNQFIAELSARDIEFRVFEFPRRGRAANNTMGALERALKTPKPGDVILSCLFDDVQEENGVFDLLNNSHLPSIIICFDNLQVWYRHRKSVAVYDVCWITSPDTSRNFRSAQAQVVYLPYAANPDLAPVADNTMLASNDPADLVFIGNPYGARELYINELSQADVPVHCYGGRGISGTIAEEPNIKLNWTYWSKRARSLMHMMFDSNGRQLLLGGLAKRFDRRVLSLPNFSPLSANDLGRVIAGSSLVLNSAVVWNSHLTARPVFKGHLRIFETAGASGLQLIEAHDDLCNWFEPGEELITFSDRAELVELAKFYMDPKQTVRVRTMKENARRRAHAEHTWTNRFKVLDNLL